MTASGADVERVELRPLAKSDGDEVFCLTSDVRVAHYMHFDVHTEPSQAACLIEELITLPNRGYAVLEEGRLIGVLGLKRDAGMAEGEYSLTTFNAPSSWNKGYATKLLERVCEIAKWGWHAKRLSAYVVSKNIGSRRVLEKNGFTVAKVERIPGLEGELYLYTKAL